MKQIAIGLAIAVVVLGAIVAVSIASAGSDKPKGDKAACEAAIQTMADRGGSASTPPECGGLTDAEISKIALRIYAEKDRRSRAED